MQTASDLAPEGPDEIVTSRTFAAPRALVYEAWTTPEHLAAWWGPDGFTTTTSALHLAEGGQRLFTMHGPDGTDYPNGITITEVRPAERLAYEHGDGTRLTMRARFPSAAARQFVAENFKAIEGGRQTLERLGRHVDTLA